MSQVMAELQPRYTLSQSMSLNSSVVRALAGVSSGNVSLSQCLGKTGYFPATSMTLGYHTSGVNTSFSATASTTILGSTFITIGCPSGSGGPTDFSKVSVTFGSSYTGSIILVNDTLGISLVIPWDVTLGWRTNNNGIIVQPTGGPTTQTYTMFVQAYG